MNRSLLYIYHIRNFRHGIVVKGFQTVLVKAELPQGYQLVVVKGEAVRLAVLGQSLLPGKGSFLCIGIKWF